MSRPRLKTHFDRLELSKKSHKGGWFLNIFGNFEYPAGSDYIAFRKAASRTHNQVYSNIPFRFIRQDAVQDVEDI